MVEEERDEDPVLVNTPSLPVNQPPDMFLWSAQTWPVLSDTDSCNSTALVREPRWLLRLLGLPHYAREVS